MLKDWKAQANACARVGELCETFARFALKSVFEIQLHNSGKIQMYLRFQVSLMLSAIARRLEEQGICFYQVSGRSRITGTSGRLRQAWG